MIQLIGKNWNNGTIINRVPGNAVAVSGFVTPGFHISRYKFSVRAKFAWVILKRDSLHNKDFMAACRLQMKGWLSVCRTYRECVMMTQEKKRKTEAEEKQNRAIGDDRHRDAASEEQKTTAENRKNAFDNLGTKVRQLRISQGMTQSEVAKALHVTPGYISNVENDRTAMSLHILIYYAKLTGLSLDELIGEVQPAYRPRALQNQLIDEISRLTPEEQEKLLKMIQIWKGKD